MKRKDLLNGLFAGDENSARLFFKRYGGLIRYAVRSIRLRSDAIKEEDLFNESVVHLLDNNKKVLKKLKVTVRYHHTFIQYAADIRYLSRKGRILLQK